MEDGKIEVLPSMHAHLLYAKLWCKLCKMSHLDERGASKDNWGVVGRLDLVGPPVIPLDSDLLVFNFHLEMAPKKNGFGPRN